MWGGGKQQMTKEKAHRSMEGPLYTPDNISLPERICVAFVEHTKFKMLTKSLKKSGLVKERSHIAQGASSNPLKN